MRSSCRGTSFLQFVMLVARRIAVAAAQPHVVGTASEPLIYGAAGACARLLNAAVGSRQNGAQSALMSSAAEPEELHHQETKITEAELRQRKSKAVNAWLEANVGTEKLRLAKILQDHYCLVRGGADNGQKLMDALLEWKAESITGTQ